MTITEELAAVVQERVAIDQTVLTYERFFELYANKKSSSRYAATTL